MPYFLQQYPKSMALKLIQLPSPFYHQERQSYWGETWKNHESYSTRKENRLRYDIVEAARLEVLRVQERQYDEGYVDEEEIAFKYSEIAYVSRLEARDRGARDEYESENKQLFSSPISFECSRRRHSLRGDGTTPTERFQPRRRLSALGHLWSAIIGVSFLFTALLFLGHATKFGR